MGKEYRAFRFRLYPDADQAVQMAKTFGCCRFLYNRMLEDKICYYEETGKMLRNTPARYKGEYPWLKEVDSLALANVQRNLEAAYRKFFREPSGKYFASLLYELDSCENQAAVRIRGDRVLGMDFAMAGLAVFSDGTRADYPMFYRKAEKKLAREQRKLSRCRKGSRNYDRQRRRVARCHEKIRNQRRDFLDKLSHRLAEEYDAVCVEDLNMKGMSRGLHLGKGVMDNANGRFQKVLEEKLARRGKTYVRIDRFFPSSKRCSCCGKIKEKLALSERIYECECGYQGDRDENAAINLRQEGIRILGWTS